VEDLHDAFADDRVAGILTMIGGYNSNQLLPYIDWELIAANPKILCGFSDITALSCSIHAKTSLVTYSGPHFSTLGMRDHVDQTFHWLVSALTTAEPFAVEAATTWSDDSWYHDQDNRDIRPNEGHWVLSEGRAEGTLLGGNLCTLNLLQGTEFMPDIKGSILFVEDDHESLPETFDRDLTSLCQHAGFDQVRGLLIGRFQATSEMTQPRLQSIVANHRELVSIPVVANVDFGHTDPMLTLPIGLTGRIDASGMESRIEVLR